MTKTTKYNKKKLVKSLDGITSNVAKRGVFVVNRSGNTFFVQNYISKMTVINDIPMRELAEKICDAYNKGRTLSNEAIHKLRVLIKSYYKYKTDLVFYRNSLHTEKDSFKFEILEARFYLTRGKYTSTRQQLEEFH